MEAGFRGFTLGQVLSVTSGLLLVNSEEFKSLLTYMKDSRDFSTPEDGRAACAAVILRFYHSLAEATEEIQKVHHAYQLMGDDGSIFLSQVPSILGRISQKINIDTFYIPKLTDFQD